MFKKSFIFFALVTSQVAIATQDCNVDPGMLGAEYVITQSDSHNHDSHSHEAERKIKSDEKTTHLTLWRKGNSVVHQYAERNISELWRKQKNDRVRLIRYFETFQRGIEYQPSEIKHGRLQQVWDQKAQLIAPELLANMKPVNVEGKGCSEVEYYELKLGEAQLTLSWMPNQQLVKEFAQDAPGATVRWVLTKTIDNVDEIKQFYQVLDGYSTTDYTDIGDMENDPFLAKMINQGFIEHGSSGIYNAQGQPLKGAHGHH